MSGLFYAVITYIGWGTGDVFGAAASRKIGGFSTTFWVFVAAAILFGLYIPFDPSGLFRYTPHLLFWNLLLGVLYVAGNVTLNIALMSSNVSVVTTIGGSFSALVVILSYVFLHQPVSLFQWIIITLIYVGVGLCTLDIRELKKGKLVHDRGLWLALFSMCAWGIYFTFVKGIMGHVGWFWPNYLSLLLFPLILIFMRMTREPLQNPIKKHALVPALLSAALLRIGDFSFNFGSALGFTTLVAPIAGAYPTLTAIIGYFVFRDPIKKQQVIGIVLSLIGIVLLSVSTVLL